VIPEFGSGCRRINPRAVRFVHWGAPKAFGGSNLERSNERLCSLPVVAGGANWRVDHLHLYLFTAAYVPVQEDVATSAHKRLSEREKRSNLYFAPGPAGRTNTGGRINFDCNRLPLSRFGVRSGRNNYQGHKLRMSLRPRFRFPFCFKKAVDHDGLKLALSPSA
jgi:hypothetical protein